MASSADHYAATTPYDPPPRHSRANSRASQACRGSEPLPRYPSAQEATTKADAGEPALPKVKKEASAAPLDVDGFSAEVSSCAISLSDCLADFSTSLCTPRLDASNTISLPSRPISASWPGSTTEHSPYPPRPRPAASRLISSTGISRTCRATSRLPSRLFRLRSEPWLARRRSFGVERAGCLSSRVRRRRSPSR